MQLRRALVDDYSRDLRSRDRPRAPGPARARARRPRTAAARWSRSRAGTRRGGGGLEVDDAGVGVARGHAAAPDVPGHAHARLADPDVAADPRVLLVGPDPSTPKVIRKRRGRPARRRRPPSATAPGRPPRASSPRPPVRGRGPPARRRGEQAQRQAQCSASARRSRRGRAERTGAGRRSPRARRAELDGPPTSVAAGKRSCSVPASGIVGGDDRHQRAEARGAHHRTRPLVDDEEGAVAGDPGLGHEHVIALLEAEPLHGGHGDPGDARRHARIVRRLTRVPPIETGRRAGKGFISSAVDRGRPRKGRPGGPDRGGCPARAAGPSLAATSRSWTRASGSRPAPPRRACLPSAPRTGLRLRVRLCGAPGMALLRFSLAASPFGRDRPVGERASVGRRAAPDGGLLDSPDPAPARSRSGRTALPAHGPRADDRAALERARRAPVGPALRKFSAHRHQNSALPRPPPRHSVDPSTGGD